MTNRFPVHGLARSIYKLSKGEAAFDGASSFDNLSVLIFSSFSKAMCFLSLVSPNQRDCCVFSLVSFNVKLRESSPGDVSVFILKGPCWAVFAQSCEMHDDRRCLLNGSRASVVIEVRVRKARISGIHLDRSPS